MISAGRRVWEKLHHLIAKYTYIVAEVSRHVVMWAEQWNERSFLHMDKAEWAEIIYEVLAKLSLHNAASIVCGWSCRLQPVCDWWWKYV